MPGPTGESTTPSRPVRDGFTFLLILGATFGLQLLTLVTGIIMARLLGVEGRGVVALVLAVSMFAAQLSFAGSLPPAVAKLVAERHGHARDVVGHVAKRRSWLVVLPCVVAGVMLLVLLDPASQDRAEIAVLTGVVALQTIVFAVLGGCLQGERRLVRMAWVALTPQGLFTVVLTVVAVADWGWSATDVLLAFVVCGLTSVVVAYLALQPGRGRSDDRVPERTLWTEARNNYVSGVRPLDGVGLDRILVGGILGTAALGLFAAGIAVANLCRLVSNAVAVVVLPRVAACQGDVVRQRAVVRRWLGISLVLVVAIVAVLQAVVEPVIRFAFGEEFLGAVEVARWLIVADGLMALRRVMIAALQGQGRGSVASWIELALLPGLVAAIVAAGMLDSLVGVGVALTGVGGAACAALAWAVLRPLSSSGRRRRR